MSFLRLLRAVNGRANMPLNLPPGVLPLQLNVNKYGRGNHVNLRPSPNEAKTAYPAVINWNEEQRFAIKVKCSDNEKYRLKPVYAIVEPQHYMQIEILRQPGPKVRGEVDKVAIQYLPVTYEETDAKNVFQRSSTDAGTLTIDIRTEQ